ncbi:MAG: prepilin peptidase [Chloroflexi bacterium]|nr:prepilin peptidase [Chloroflexota bacterium]MBI3340780.1 prepilin peptidase [Chloroflexota bacterium]
MPYVAYGLLTALVFLGGIQDWSRGEVSNWISIPLFAAGLTASVLRLFSRGQRMAGIAIGMIVLALTLSALKGWMGGADWKILVGLFGLWPFAGLTALAAAGVWGGVEMLRTRNPNARFPGVTAFAFATALTFLAQFFIMPLN